MYSAENPHPTSQKAQSIRGINYAAFLELTNYAGLELDELQQELLTRETADPAEKTQNDGSIRSVCIDTDPQTGHLLVASILEAKDEVEATDRLAHAFFYSATRWLPQYVEYYQLIEAHVGIADVLSTEHPEQPPLRAIQNRDYCRDELISFDVNPDNQEPIMVEASKVVYMARDDALTLPDTLRLDD